MQEYKKSKFVKWVSIICSIIIFLAFIIPIPINREYDAIEIKLDDPSYLVQRKIKIRGKYHWNILTRDVFDGQIIVSDYEITTKK